MKNRKAHPPMLVMRHLKNTDLETKELIAVRAFTLGVAKKQHFDLLLDMANVLMVAGGSAKHRAYAMDYATKNCFPVLSSIKNRFDKTGKLGVSAQEMRTLAELVEFSKQFWNRQPINLYMECCKELQAYYDELKDDRIAVNAA